MADNAEVLAEEILNSFTIQTGATAYWSHPSRADALARLFRTNGRGGPTCYDAWNGTWKGTWKKPGQSAEDAAKIHSHIWDETQRVTYGRPEQYVQPVTQSRMGFQSNAKIPKPPGEIPETNIAINVWSPADGLTGWVGWGGRCDPHIAYLINPHTLIWVMQYQECTKLADTFLVFFEWVASDHRSYGIHGRFFEVAKVMPQPAAPEETPPEPRRTVKVKSKKKGFKRQQEAPADTAPTPAPAPVQAYPSGYQLRIKDGIAGYTSYLPPKTGAFVVPQTECQH
ncbi:MAG: hypothetical protein AAF281_03095 [Pseudomonadota bacterium]